LAGVSDQYLADACALIAFFADADLRPDVRRLITEADIAVSAITVWEITRKAALGKLPANWGENGLSALLQQQGFRPLPVTWSDAERANRLPPVHKDPMDRMLIAQALRRDMTIITDNRLFAEYSVKTIW
jgi:PIN domain nuclease of toxin-antitoxin system